MRVLLLFPPYWTPAMPHLALPTLTSHLRAQGIEVIQRDLNLETFDTILTRAYVEQSLARLHENHGARKRPHARPTGDPPRDKVRWALAEGPRLAGQVEAAKRVMRSDDFFNGPRGVRAFLDIAASLEIASLPFYPSSLDLLNYIPPAPVDSSRSLLQLVGDPQHNLFLDLFRRAFLPDIIRTQPDLVGISIPTMAQLLPGLTLAHLIKQAGLDCHITAGGPHITMLREELPKVPALFDLFDSAVLFDGEEPLVQIAQALDGDRDLSRVPNLAYRDGKQIRVTEHVKPAEPQFRLPDFDGLPLDRYLAPRLILPLLTARGCYHGKCAFCSVGYGAPAAYRQMRGEQIVEQMLALRDKYGARHIFFADEAVSPRNLREMSVALEKLGAPMHWCGCARFEKTLSQEVLKSIARGGGRMLLFGLESASEPISERMVKGTQSEQVARVLDEGAQAGIWNHVFFFFGFPGEMIEHAQETLDFVYAHQPSIHSASPGTFVLERYAPAHLSPQTYGIKRIVRRPDQDLAIYFDYEVESGMDAQLAELAVSRFLEVLPEKRFGHFYANDAYRFLYASHLREQGKSLPPWLASEVE